MLRVVVLEAYEPRLKWLACHVVNRNDGPPVVEECSGGEAIRQRHRNAKVWLELTERIVRVRGCEALAWNLDSSARSGWISATASRLLHRR